MAFFAMYGDKYSVEDAEYLILMRSKDLAFKLFIDDDLEFHTLLGELRVIPVGTINENGIYTKEINLDEV